MTAKDLRQRIGKLSWELDFYAFVREILQAEPRDGDPWQKEMWDNFKRLTQAVGRFDDTILSRILFDDNNPPDDEHDIDPVQADADVLASAGWGTDEDYGRFSDDEY